MTNEQKAIILERLADVCAGPEVGGAAGGCRALPGARAKCGCQGGLRDTRADAIAAWNRRGGVAYEP